MTSQAEQKLDYALTAAFFGSVVVLLFESRGIENTIGGLKFFCAAFLLGAGIGIFLSWRFCRSRLAMPSQKSTLVGFYFAVGLTSGFITVAVASKLNRSFGGSTAYVIPYVVTGKCAGGRNCTNETHFDFLLVRIGQGEEKVFVRHYVWKTICAGDTAILTQYRGLFGFSVVTKVEKQQAGQTPTEPRVAPDTDHNTTRGYCALDSN